MNRRQIPTEGQVDAVVRPSVLPSAATDTAERGYSEATMHHLSTSVVTRPDRGADRRFTSSHAQDQAMALAEAGAAGDGHGGHGGPWS